ncbi:MAG: hypothetical protein ACMG6E_08970 [Candidatus Roizmanbacteria bacterium]
MSENEIIVTCTHPEQLKGLFGFDTLTETSKYRAWSSNFGNIFKAYPCRTCADLIADRFDADTLFTYTIEESESGKGYWTRDLP